MERSRFFVLLVIGLIAWLIFCGVNETLKKLNALVLQEEAKYSYICTKDANGKMTNCEKVNKISNK